MDQGAEKEFSFTFNDSGGVESVRLPDGWSTRMSIEEFDEQLLRAYHQQRPIPVIAAGAVRDRDERWWGEALAASREVNELARRALGGMRWSASAQPPEPQVVTDRRGRVEVTVVDAVAQHLDIRDTWQRSAEPADVEAAVVEALRAVEELSETPGESADPIDAMRLQLEQLRRITQEQEQNR